MCPVSGVICHVSPVTCHLSRVTCHLSKNILYIKKNPQKKLDKVVELVGGGSVINGTFPVELFFLSLGCLKNLVKGGKILRITKNLFL